MNKKSRHQLAQQAAGYSFAIRRATLQLILQEENHHSLSGLEVMDCIMHAKGKVVSAETIGNITGYGAHFVNNEAGKRLVSHGWVEKTSDGYKATQKGIDDFMDIVKRYVAFRQSFTAALTDEELETFVKLEKKQAEFAKEEAPFKMM